MPPSRSSSTCKQCRVRKVKCNATTSASGGRCANCDRLGFECSFTKSRLTLGESPCPERRRGARACTECRTQKSRCSGELPTCAACERRGKECVYPGIDRRRTSDAPSATSFQQSPTFSTASSHAAHGQLSPNVASFATEAQTENVVPSPTPTWRSRNSSTSRTKGSGPALPLPPVREQLQLVIDFFRHVHPLPVYSFLNEVSVTQRCLDGTVDETLLLSLCAISSLQLGYTKYHPAFTASWIKKAEDTIWAHIDQPTIFRTQALILVIRYHIDVGDFQKAFMLSSIASRAASALRLQYERTDLSRMAQEIRRRLMWCLALMDGHFSTGLPECEMCPFETLYLQMPCKEEEFSADHGSTAGMEASLPLDGVSEDGLLSTIIRESMVRRDIMRLKRQVSLYSQPMPQLEAIVTEFDRTLTGISIPQYSIADLRKYANSRWLVRYVGAQLSWRQCYLDIYRHFLPGYTEAAPAAVISAFSQSYISEAARLCLYYAQSSIEILNDLGSIASNFKVVDIDFAICGYHAARVVMFISRSSLKPSESDVTPEKATDMAISVLEILRRLSRSQLIAKVIGDLDTIIQSHTANEGEPSRDSSDADDDRDGETQVPRFALAAKQHQRLGIHSVLRQARFVDDSHIAADAQPRRPRDATEMDRFQPDTSIHNFTAPGMPFAQPATLTTDIGNNDNVNLQGGSENLSAISQFHLNTDPFNFGSVNHWSELYLPHDFSSTSDGHFF